MNYNHYYYYSAHHDTLKTYDLSESVISLNYLLTNKDTSAKNQKGISENVQQQKKKLTDAKVMKCAVTCRPVRKPPSFLLLANKNGNDGLM